MAHSRVVVVEHLGEDGLFLVGVERLLLDQDSAPDEIGQHLLHLQIEIHL